MHIGRIIGTVVATPKDERLMGCKLMLTQPLNIDKNPVGEPLVAVDTIGAGIGEIVLYARGTAARYAANRLQSPIDASIVGIIDHIDIPGD
ncbi:Ethanolamine utilization protein EutN/carboxysome structural protein Ccml [Alkaliphilus metalliredigens QYMF]|uniref:Ethanolamine utilization protein EutN/carboxysome structural protein Ccml n=1 Tax=Alkaliphilus metalliredigens (strain QYMF) TaxID=293826 RepID=A6TWS8_ALKMQ|nr:EutN/CcmL family microcompartment protein [Alkaliphilus metalliredigens]ABR50646.1 Ethanolamine utilization protein EutN/carboxysome structural protein Ccml [Alkaliphilus metalliredigens QYMF]